MSHVAIVGTGGDSRQFAGRDLTHGAAVDAMVSRQAMADATALDACLAAARDR